MWYRSAQNIEPPLIKDGLTDGRTTSEDAPNMSSIDSSLANYTILPGIRNVLMEEFEDSGFPLSFYSSSEKERTETLAKQIVESNYIAPLIVVYDNDPRGPYILEGGHRFDALRLLKAISFPAVVVIDHDGDKE